jgi:hypothetical protein
VAIGDKNPNSIIVGLFVQSLNEVIDLHAKRVQAGLRSRIPGAIWVGLFAVAALSLAAMGYQAGLVGTRRSLAVPAMAIAFSVVIELIADLDRPKEGVLKVSQGALLDFPETNCGKSIFARNLVENGKEKWTTISFFNEFVSNPRLMAASRRGFFHPVTATFLDSTN